MNHARVNFFILLILLLALAATVAFIRYVVLENFFIYKDEQTIPATITDQFDEIRERGL